MDPVTIGAVLQAIVSGAGEGLGGQLWEGMTALIRRPLRGRVATSGGTGTVVVPAGKAELAAFQLAPGDQQKVMALAEALLARAGADPKFRQALEDWWIQAEPIRAGIGNVTNTISGGTQQGPVLQGRDFSDITFGARPPASPPLDQGAGTADDGGRGTHSGIGGGIQLGPVLQGRDFRVTFVTNQATAAPVALAQLPAQVVGFTGRGEELAQITALLDPAGEAGTVVVSAVAGLAGVGKSALAIQAGHAARAAGWFAGGVLFIDLHGYDDAPVEPGQALDALLRALGVPSEHVPPGTEERGGLWRSVLAQISEPLLIIADNASSEMQVRPLLPGIGQTRVVVTSRHTLAGLGARLLDVTALDDPTGVALLAAALQAARPGDDRISGDRGAAERLAGICGGLPLALWITAALLAADPALTVVELGDELADEVHRLEALRYDDGSGTSAPSVAAAFELSYRQLDQATGRMFRLLPASPGPDLSTAAAAALADRPVSETRKVIGQLVRAHLVEAAPAAGRWRMHDLLRLYARQLSESHADADGRAQAQDRLLDYYLNSAQMADDHLRALPGIPVPARFSGRNDALAWLDGERTSLIPAVTLAASTGRDQIAMKLPLNLNEYLPLRRRFDDWLAVISISRDAARRLGHKANEASALNNLSVALGEVGRVEEAISAHHDAAALFREIGDRHREGMALNNLGIALQRMGRFEEAVSAHQDAAAIARETGDRRLEGTALGNVGLALRGVGRFEEAIGTYQYAAEIARETGDRNGEGGALANLGVALRKVGRVEEAISAHQGAAALFREIGDRYHEGMTLNNLGEMLREMGRFEEAISAHQDAAAIARETGDRRLEGTALGNVGLALRGVGRFEEAISAHQDAAAIYREAGNRDGEGTALTGLGLALQEAGRFEEAISAHQDAAAIYREAGNRDGEGTALTGLGMALRDVGRFEEAISAHQNAAAIYRETGDRYGESLALNNLGIALQEVGRFEEAISAHRDAAPIYRQAGNRYGEGTALNNLGVALRKVGRVEEAISAHQDAAALYRETGDRHHESAALDTLGTALQEAGRVEEAISAHQDAAALYRETGDRPGEARALTGLGLPLEQAGRFEEAISTYQDAAALYQEVSDRDHEGMALYNLGTALQGAGRAEEAISAYQDAGAISRETGDRYYEGKALTGLGLALLAVGRLEEAISAHQDAAALYGETGDRPGEATALTGLGIELQVMGRFEEAISAYQDAAALFREAGDRHGEAMALNNLGLPLRKVGRFEEAISAHQDAAALFKETSDQQGESTALNNLEEDRAAARMSKETK